MAGVYSSDPRRTVIGRVTTVTIVTKRACGRNFRPDGIDVFAGKSGEKTVSRQPLVGISATLPDAGEAYLFLLLAIIIKLLSTWRISFFDSTASSCSNFKCIKSVFFI